MYQQAGSKIGAWLDRYVPFVSKTWKAFSMLGDVGKVIAGGATVAALLFGGPAVNEALTTDSSGPCPKNWQYNYAQEGDAVRETCWQAPWSVVLNADKSCNYGLNTSDPNAKPVDCEAVPNWSGS